MNHSEINQEKEIASQNINYKPQGREYEKKGAKCKDNYFIKNKNRHHVANTGKSSKIRNSTAKTEIKPIKAEG